jgi:hypothetical protein
MFALHGRRPRIRLDLVLIVAVALALVVLASGLSGSPEVAVRLVIAAFATTLIIERLDAH